MRLHSVVYAIIAFVMLLVGLEEIAWGQILFGWKTPENIAAVNAQNQTTLHNLEFFQNYLDLNLFLVSVVLLVLVLWRPSIRRMRTTILDEGRIPNSNFFIPRYFWPLFFCAAFLSYFVATESGTELVINIDQEWAEFLLYLAAGLNLHPSWQRSTATKPLNNCSMRPASALPLSKQGVQVQMHS